MFRDFEHEEERFIRNQYNYIGNESNSDKNKTLIEEYLNKIRPYLKDSIYDLKESDTWKIQIAISNQLYVF